MCSVGEISATPTDVRAFGRRARIVMSGAAIGVIGVITSTVSGLAHAQTAGTDSALATLCVALRTGTSAFLRDQLGCSPDQPALPAELRPCRVSWISTEPGAHGRTISTLTWSDDGHLALIESGAQSWTFEYASGRLAAIRGTDAASRDEEIAYHGSDVVIDAHPRSGAGLRTRTRYVHEAGALARIESTLGPGLAPDTITTLVREHGRLSEIVTNAGGEVWRARIEWDARARPRRWARQDAWSAQYTFEWDGRDWLARVTARSPGSRTSSLALVEYACAAPPAPVRTPEGVLFCRRSADCARGERCVHARDGSLAATYCARTVDDSVIVIDP